MIEFKKKVDAAGERLLRDLPGALEEVIGLYQKRIYNLAFRFTCDKEEAFDLSQEIFLRLYSKIKLFSPKTDFNAWFMRLAVNASINYRTKVRRNPSHFAYELIEDNKTFSKNSIDQIEKESLHRRINSLLAQLPRRERMAITLQLWEKKKVKEIAEMMKTSVKSVESLLTRARKRLRKITKK